MFPAISTATPVGVSNDAAVPVPFANAAVPLPANVLTICATAVVVVITNATATTVINFNILFISFFIYFLYKPNLKSNKCQCPSDSYHPIIFYYTLNYRSKPQ